MSLHPSLKIPDKFKGKRNVLSRSERIKGLIRDEQWKEGDSLFGLPKTKLVIVKKKKKEKKEAEGSTDTAAAPAAEKAVTSEKK